MKSITVLTTDPIPTLASQLAGDDRLSPRQPSVIQQCACPNPRDRLRMPPPPWPPPPDAIGLCRDATLSALTAHSIRRVVTLSAFTAHSVRCTVTLSALKAQASRCQPEPCSPLRLPSLPRGRASQGRPCVAQPRLPCHPCSLLNLSM